MLYTLARLLVKGWLHLRFRINVSGIENIPDSACILAMNHTSNYDPLLVGVHTPRKMHIMAKEELFANPLFSRLLHQLGAFPVKRGQGDVKSLKYTLQLLSEGKLFAIFIEGTRVPAGETLEPKKGIGFIVRKSGAPVIPTYIAGAKRGWFGQAEVIFGKPLTFSDDEDYEQIAAKVMEGIQGLKRHS
jgi:1-acyl-sn-glycerol-3-phosphate acyltransferase